MVSIRGPRRWARTLASISSPSTSGAPTWIVSPSCSSRTRPNLTDEPGSAASRSTRTWSPGATRYCFPPLTTTAVSNPSGLGTVRHCTSGTTVVLERQPYRAGVEPIRVHDLPLMDHQAAPQDHRLGQPEAGQGRDRGRPSVRDQRERDPGDREHADVHADVLDDLDEEHHEDAAGDQLAEAIRRHRGGLQQANQQGAEDGEQGEAPQEAELLGKDGKHEVGRALGYEAKLPLQPMQPALAEVAPRADRDSRLQQVVAGAERIAARVEEDLEPAALISVQQVGQRGDGDKRCDGERRE